MIPYFFDTFEDRLKNLVSNNKNVPLALLKREQVYHDNLIPYFFEHRLTGTTDDLTRLWSEVSVSEWAKDPTAERVLVCHGVAQLTHERVGLLEHLLETYRETYGGHHPIQAEITKSLNGL